MIKKISFSDYAKSPELNMSALCNMLKSPAHFQWAKQNPKDSKSLAKGRAIHTLVLEPNLFWETYVVEPRKEDYKYVTADDLKPLLEKLGLKAQKTKGKTIEAILAHASVEQEDVSQIYDLDLEKIQSCGKEILSFTEYSEAKAVAESVLKSPKINNMIQKGQAEVSIFLEVLGVPMKFRPDLMAPDFIVDLKTCRSCDERSFQRDFVDYNYDIKLAAYQYACEQITGKKPTVIVLAAETVDEYDYQVFKIDQDFLDIGLKKFFKLVEQYKECQKKNEWPGLDKSIKILCAPEWYLKQNLE